MRTLATAVLAAGTALGLALASAGPAAAASYEIVPVRVELQAGQATAAITVRNLSDSASTVQARAFGWTQQGDRDTLTPTQEIGLSPPIFTLAAGQQQTIRFILRNTAPTPVRAYRILFDEIPPTAAPGQIQMAMRVSIPVLLDPPPGPRPPLQWRAVRERAGTVALFVSNSSQTVARIVEVTARLANGRSVPVRPAADNTYVMPGGERRWVMQGALPPGGAINVTTTTQAGPSEQAIPLPP